MKRTITLFTLLLFAGIMLPSCGLTIVKRQHTGGYYISTNSRNHATKGEASIRTEDSREAAAALKEEKQTAAEELAVAETSAAAKEQETVTDAPATNAVHNDAAPEGSEKASTTARKPLLNSLAERAENVPMTKKMDSAVKKMKSKATSSRGGDGLSLLWIVILILLLLWAIGLISGGWGLGGLLYILLVIAIVLLILWLLRII